MKLYLDFMSQPSRAVYIFLKSIGVNFETVPIALRKGEQFSEKFQAINPFMKVPVIEDNGFVLTESIAITRYVADTQSCPDKMYPQNIKDRSRVDEFLEWQHLNIRLGCAKYFLVKFAVPAFSKVPPKPRQLEKAHDEMIKVLDILETVWLGGDKTYLVGNNLTVADIFGACEVEQPVMAGYDPREEYPNIKKWLETVSKELNPHYDDAHKILRGVAQKFKGEPPM